MFLSNKKQYNKISNPATTDKKVFQTSTPFEWSKVVAGKARTTQSFAPTYIQTKTSTKDHADMADSDMSGTQESPIQVVRPFLKWIEKHSVLIDVTDVKSPQLLRQALQNFNREALENEEPEDYCGRLPTVRKYLNRSFIETVWSLNSQGRKKIIEEGITLEDNTFVQGFCSFPADSRIVRITLDKLPLKPLRLLKADMEEQLSVFGKVLDLGVTRSNGCFMGQGYATLDLSSTADMLEYEPLKRIMTWIDDDGDIRQVLLQWEDMPDFCRLCQRPGHCRTDCPDYQKYLKCHNCNLSGHIMRNCPRNNNSAILTQNKKRSTQNVKKERKSGNNNKKEDIALTVEPESAAIPMDIDKELTEEKSTSKKTSEHLDTESNKLAHISNVDKPKNNDNSKLILPRSPPVNPQVEAAKVSKLSLNSDISSSRKDKPFD